jgi:hypothetical protein
MDRRFERRRWSVAFGAVACAVVLACIGVALGVAALFETSAPSFAAARNYATGRGPGSVAIGDLNGDGKPDLAVWNASAHTVSILLNGGDGSFEARRDYQAGGRGANWGGSVAIADLNGDGRPDLATANASASSASVLLNRGDGSFEAGRDYATGRQPLSVAIGDLNGDGNADLATANATAFTASVLLNRGDGSFAAKRDYRTGGGPTSVALGDLNGDDKPDLVTSNSDGGDTISVLVNRGDGSFRAKRDYRTGGGPTSVGIADLNGDGRSDVATANVSESSVSVLVNRGDGSFRARRDYRTGSIPTSVAVGDLTDDGKPDLVTANFHLTNVSVLPRGDGSFQAKLDYGTRRSAKSVAIGDLNGDGEPDLATANRDSNTVSVLINTPGLCAVQNVENPAMTLPAAKRTIERVSCRVGRIRRAYSKWVRKGRVISENPKPGTVLPAGGKVNLIVSRGRKR